MNRSSRTSVFVVFIIGGLIATLALLAYRWVETNRSEATASANKMLVAPSIPAKSNVPAAPKLSPVIGNVIISSPNSHTKSSLITVEFSVTNSGGAGGLKQAGIALNIDGKLILASSYPIKPMSGSTFTYVGQGQLKGEDYWFNKIGGRAIEPYVSTPAWILGFFEGISREELLHQNASVILMLTDAADTKSSTSFKLTPDAVIKRQSNPLKDFTKKR